MDLKEITELIKVVESSRINEFKLQTNDFTIKMRKGGGGGGCHHSGANSGHHGNGHPRQMEPPRVSGSPYENIQEPITIIPEEPKIVVSGNTVDSPIVGTFYRSPAPDKPAFVEKGATVKKGDVLCLIEAMKVMNEITSRHDGVVTEILAENGKLVEYGQPLFRIE